MKNLFSTNYIKYVLLVFIVLFFTGCSEYLDDPFIEEESSEKPDLIVVDFNSFSTSMTYKLLDANDCSPITREAKITFSGQNKDDIITFAGENKEDFQTLEGHLELIINPNVTITENVPVEYAIHVAIEGYNSLDKGIQIFNEGKKTYELFLTKIEDEKELDLTGNVDFSNGDTVFYFFEPLPKLKSAIEKKKSYEINYSLSIKDLLKFKDTDANLLFNSSYEVIAAYNQDQENFIRLLVGLYTNCKPGVETIKNQGKEKSVLFQKLESGRKTSLIINEKEVGDLNGGAIRSLCKYIGENTPENFGFYRFENGCWKSLGKELKHNEADFTYTLAKIKEDSVCKKGARFSFKSDLKSGFSIDADIYDLQDNFIASTNFKGNFHETFALENIPNIPVKLFFRNNNCAFDSIPPMEIKNVCSGNHKIDISKNDCYTSYQINFKAICADNPAIAITPAYSAEIKLKGSNDLWQGIIMESGVANVLCVPNEEYQIRLLWENEWVYSTFYTEFDSEGNYLHKTNNDTKIESNILNDGTIQISIEKIVSKDICTLFGY